MQRLLASIAGLGLTVSAFAAYPAASDPTEISIPQLTGGFFIGGTAYYLRPSVTADDLDFFFSTSASGASTFSHVNTIDPGYTWGWGANIGYIFPNTGNDVNLSYFQIEPDDSGSAADSFVDGGIPIQDAIRATSEFDIKQVDLTLGQYIDVGCRLRLHPIAGGRYLDFDRTIKFHLVTDVIDPEDPFTQTVDLRRDGSFTGAGPLVGIDGSYYIGYGLGLVGHFDSALLLGDIDDDLTILNTISDTPPTTTTTAKVDSTRIVPVVDGKLGADYTFLFNNNANSGLTLEVGYQVDHYFRVIDRISTDALDRHGTMDFALSGPYASLTLHI